MVASLVQGIQAGSSHESSLEGNQWFQFDSNHRLNEGPWFLSTRGLPGIHWVEEENHYHPKQFDGLKTIPCSKNM